MAGLAILATLPIAAAQNSCPGSLDELERQRYTVSSVAIRTPLTLPWRPLNSLFLGKIDGLLSPVERELPLRPGAPFLRAQYAAGMLQLQDKYGAQALDSGVRLRLAVVVPDVANCDAAAKTVEVVYRVYTTDTAYFLAQIFETRLDRSERKLAVGPGAQTEGKILPRPFLGYNHTRGVFGGTRASFASSGGVFDRIDASVGGSGSSNEAALSFSGEREFAAGLLSHAEWGLGYRRSSVPAGSADLNGATLWGRFIGASRALGSAGVILRFGSGLEGGYRQSDVAGRQLTPDVVARASYGAWKNYLGATLNRGRQALAVSYGLQAGKVPDSFQIGYLKSVVDAAYRGRFLPWEHLPFRVEADLGAGWIHRLSGPVPLAEQFFGGNVSHNFMEGDSWRLRSAPFIRSIPENRLGEGAAGGPIGGTRFLSANVTLAQTVWRYPAIPPEVRFDPDFYGGLLLVYGPVLVTSMQDYIVRSDGFAQQVRRLPELEALLGDYDRELAGILARNPTAEIRELVRQISDNASTEDGETTFDDPLHKVRSATEAIRRDPEGPDARTKIRGLVFDQDEEDSPVTSLVKLSGDLVSALAAAGLGPDAAAAKATTGALAQLQSQMRAGLEALERLTSAEPGTLAPVFTDLDALASALQALKDAADRLAANADPAVASAATAAARAAEMAGNKIPDRTDTPRTILMRLDDLAGGMGKVVPALAEEAEARTGALAEALDRAGLAADAAATRTGQQAVRAVRLRIVSLLEGLRRPPGERWAYQQTAYFRNTLDVLVREFNVAGVSPLVLFDIARLGPQPLLRFPGTHYAAGLGVRLSLASADFSVGYAWNLNGAPGLGRGALFFALDIADLFR